MSFNTEKHVTYRNHSEGTLSRFVPPKTTFTGTLFQGVPGLSLVNNINRLPICRDNRLGTSGTRDTPYINRGVLSRPCLSVPKGQKCGEKHSYNVGQETSRSIAGHLGRDKGCISKSLAQLEEAEKIEKVKRKVQDAAGRWREQDVYVPKRGQNEQQVFEY